MYSTSSVYIELSVEGLKKNGLNTNGKYLSTRYNAFVRGAAIE